LLIAGLFETLAEPLIDTRLEPDVPDLLWSLTDLFHRKAARVQRQLDDNEDRQRRCQTEQDGSEIRSVELERLIAHTPDEAARIANASTADVRAWVDRARERRWLKACWPNRSESPENSTGAMRLRVGLGSPPVSRNS
jgi:hypothetical protein